MDDRIQMTVRYLNEFNLELDSQYLIDRVILRYGDWETHIISYIKNFVVPGMVVVDVGANAGYHTLLMAKQVGMAGKVHAFEPNPDARLRITRNLEINPELKSIVSVYPQGLGEEAKVLYLEKDLEIKNFGNAKLVSSPSKSDDQVIDVRRLDDFITDTISFIKIDVEGMELEVLKGAKNHIERSRPKIVYETLKSLPPENHKPIEDFLRSYGYRIFCPAPNQNTLLEITYPNYPFEDCLAIYHP